MAKVKGYLAGSKGKIGNLTFYHNGANGETQVREIVALRGENDAYLNNAGIGSQEGTIQSGNQRLVNWKLRQRTLMSLPS